jgi:hypothetical protein
MGDQDLSVAQMLKAVATRAAMPNMMLTRTSGVIVGIVFFALDVAYKIGWHT